MTKYCKTCNCILNSDEKHSNRCFCCYSNYVKNNSNNKPPANDTKPIKNKKCQLAISYFSNYLINSEHIYCGCCDEYIMTYSYIAKHVKTPKHALNVDRLNNFINKYQSKFTNEDRQLINDVLKVNFFELK
jgi:hypothetical protein